MAAARRHRVWLRDEAECAATLTAVSAPRHDVSPLPAGAAAPATPASATPHTLEIRARGASPAPQSPARMRHEDAVIAAALAILDARLRVPAGLFTSPQAVKDFLRLHLAEREREAFAVLFLDNRHAAIGFDVLFEGTLTHTSVHPREIVRRAMSLNAAAVILSHNHPSGEPEPSRADEMVTLAIKAALRLVEVRVLDHVVIAGDRAVSFAELGLL